MYYSATNTCFLTNALYIFYISKKAMYFYLKIIIVSALLIIFYIVNPKCTLYLHGQAMKISHLDTFYLNILQKLFSVFSHKFIKIKVQFTRL